MWRQWMKNKNKRRGNIQKKAIMIPWIKWIIILAFNKEIRVKKTMNEKEMWLKTMNEK